MKSDRKVGGLGWWKAITGLLALALLLDFSFSALGWPGMATLLVLVVLAVSVRHRFPFVTTAIETILGVILLVCILLNIIGWIVGRRGAG